VPLASLRQIAEHATGGLRPVRTVLLDLPPDAGLARRAHGSEDDLTRFELDPSHDLSFHQRVRDGYLQLALDEPGRWRVVDAARDSGRVARDVRAAVSDVLPQT
jgi:dTMP kinase